MKGKQDKILYLMHIDWNWIKQRPQFLAEGLAKNYKVTCVYPFSWRLKKKIKNSHDNVKLIPIFQIPFNKNKIIRYLNRYISNTIIKFIALFWNFEVIIVPSPWLYKNWMAKKKIIYDCMDNYKAFIPKSDQEIFARKEKDIVSNSTLISASSNYIISDLINNYDLDNSKIELIRNGYNNKNTSINLSIKSNSKRKYKFAYIGTIASWFDFELLKKVLMFLMISNII